MSSSTQQLTQNRQLHSQLHYSQQQQSQTHNTTRQQQYHPAFLSLSLPSQPPLIINKYPKLRTIKSQKFIPSSYNGVQMQGQCDRKFELTQQKQIHQKFIQLRLLTKEKDTLMRELSQLKQGAVQALKQKQQIIQNLRTHTPTHIDTSYCNFEEQRTELQKQVSRYQRRVKQLEQQIKQIQQKCSKQRSFYFQQLYTKQSLIDQLMSKISYYQNQLHKSDQNAQKQRQQFASQAQLLDSKFIQMQASIQQQKQYYQSLQSNIKQQYQKQLNKICAYYQNQIKVIKQLYEKQFVDGVNHHLRTLETQAISDQEENQSVYDLLSFKSGFNYNRNQGTDSQHGLRPKQLKYQIKDIKKASDQEKSEFTNNYFNYDHKIFKHSPTKQLTPPNSPYIIDYKHTANPEHDRQVIEQNKQESIVKQHSNPQMLEQQYRNQVNIVDHQVSTNNNKNSSNNSKSEGINKRQIGFILGGGVTGAIAMFLLCRLTKIIR